MIIVYQVTEILKKLFTLQNVENGCTPVADRGIICKISSSPLYEGAGFFLLNVFLTAW